MITVITTFCDRYIRYAKDWKDCPQRAYDMAFGGIQLIAEAHPEQEEEIIKLWYDTYAPQFEKIVNGK